MNKKGKKRKGKTIIVSVIRCHLLTLTQACYSFIFALDKWHNYLSGIKFTWETDHKAVTQLNKKAQNNKRYERWKLKMLEYDL